VAISIIETQRAYILGILCDSHVHTVFVDQPAEFLQSMVASLGARKVGRMDQQRLNRVQPVPFVGLCDGFARWIVLEVLISINFVVHVMMLTSPDPNLLLMVGVVCAGIEDGDLARLCVGANVRLPMVTVD